MTKTTVGVLLVSCLTWMAGADRLHGQTERTYTPVRDNTLYESSTGASSNGKGRHLFVGATAQGALRRTLLAFDVADIAEGSTIEAAQLTVTMSRTVGSATTVSLYRVLSSWGEGSSEAGANEGQGGPSAVGDATWIHRLFSDSLWTEPGGDFVQTPSAATSVAAAGTYTFGPTEAMTSDVASWLENPDRNFGWILVGDETGSSTAKRFDSKDHEIEAVRPKLLVSLGVATSSEDHPTPGILNLAQNYPNPVHKSTTIRYSVGKPGSATLDLIDVLGKVVRTRQIWTGRSGWVSATIDANDLTPGWYAYRLTSPDGSVTRTMLISR